MRVPKVITEAATEVLTLDEVRRHLRLDVYDSPAVHPDDPLIEALITVAREAAEKFTGRSIIQKTLELALDEFPYSPWWSTRRVYAIELPGGPVQALLSMLYDDGTSQSYLTEYQLDNHSAPPRILPAVNGIWPTTSTGINAVLVRYLVGYSLPGDSPFYEALPKSIKQAMLLTISHFYENREDTSITELYEIPMGAKALLRNYRIEKAMA